MPLEAVPAPAGPLVVRASADASGEALVRALGLPPPRATLVLNGSTTPLPGGLGERIAAVLADGVAALARRERLTVLTGGTDAGIFSLYARGVNDLSAPLVGVAPAGLVNRLDLTGREREDAGVAPVRSDGSGDTAGCGDPAGSAGSGGPDLAPLEPCHSHHLLVDGHRWGDETPAMLRLAEALGRGAPSAALLVGGGDGAARETAEHLRTGRPVLVLAGSGRLADDIARRRRGGPAAGPTAPATAALVDEIAASPLVTVVELDRGPGAVTDELARLLGLGRTA